MIKAINGMSVKNWRDDILYEKIPYDSVGVNIIVMNTKEYEVPDTNAHFHHGVEIIMPVSGSFRIMIEGSVYIIKRSEIAIINHNEIHSTSLLEADEKYRCYIIQLEYDMLQSIYPEIDHIKFRNHISKNHCKLKKLIEYFCNEYITEHRLATMGFVYLLIDELSLYVSDRMINKCSNPTPDFVIAIMHYIDEHYREDIKMTSLAKQFSFSYGYMLRAFKDHTHITIKEYLNNKRLEKATGLLLHSKYTIKEIAIESGFPNTKSFHNTFKQYHGTTPNVFRNKFKNDSQQVINELIFYDYLFYTYLSI